MSGSTLPAATPKVMANWMMAIITPPSTSVSSGKVLHSQVFPPTGVGVPTEPLPSNVAVSEPALLC